MQGEPLDMFAYKIGVLLLINFLKAEYPDISQPYYLDDDGTLGMFNNIGLYFNSLIFFYLGHEYYPKSSKTSLILQV